MKKHIIGTPFPSVSVEIANYSPTAFCITLKEISNTQLAQINLNKVDMVDKRRILYHEMRHNLDHLSTLWGQKAIYGLFQAINARLSQNENDFHRIIKHKIAEKQLSYATYYTQDFQRVSYSGPQDQWGWRLSTGMRYDTEGNLTQTNPILFINFLKQDQSRINRVPLSIAALLETNSMYEETIVELDHLNTRPAEKQPKEKQDYINEFFRSVIYNQDMAIYNCAVHLCANMLVLYDSYDAFKIASAVATVVLNLPSAVIQDIPIDHEAMAAWTDRPSSFIANHDYGFLFYILLHNYRTEFLKTKMFDLDVLLSINNLPNVQTLESQVIAEMTQLATNYQPTQFFATFFKDRADSGLKLFQARGIDGQKITLRDTFKTGAFAPFVVTSNKSFPPSTTLLKIMQLPTPQLEITPEGWYHLASELSYKMEEFFQIRGI